ncbi:MAG: DUF4232 domain-containing protein [Firmicutes bacterium]|nr:DUF4232 domain-containing protein [Bacillota bacterium]
MKPGRSRKSTCWKDYSRTRGILVIAAMGMATIISGCGSAAPAALGKGSHPPVTRQRQSSADAVVESACTANNLSVQGGREGENMGAHMDVLLRNQGTAACVLEGLPVSARLLPRGGKALTTTLIPDPSNLQASSVLLKPHAQNAADLVLYWGNWCGPAPGPLDIQITLSGNRGTVSGPLNGPPDYNYLPQCLQPNQPSTIQILEAYAMWR